LLNSPPPLREVHHIGDTGFGYAILSGDTFVSSSFFLMEADNLLFKFGSVVL
jgi:dTDP-glucose pyrophosphorylase